MSRLERLSATGWQFIRMGLHRMWIGRFLSRRNGGLFKPESARMEALNSAKELALVYHRMNQLHLSSNMKDANGLMFALCSVNLAEAAGSTMEPENLMDIYLTAALRVKLEQSKANKFDLQSRSIEIPMGVHALRLPLLGHTSLPLRESNARDVSLLQDRQQGGPVGLCSERLPRALA
jgi:hypothetical protein